MTKSEKYNARMKERFQKKVKSKKPRDDARVPVETVFNIDRAFMTVFNIDRAFMTDWDCYREAKQRIDEQRPKPAYKPPRWDKTVKYARKPA